MSNTKKKSKTAKAAPRAAKRSVTVVDGKAAIAVTLSVVPTTGRALSLEYLYGYESCVGRFDGSLADAKLFLCGLEAAITEAARLEGAVSHIYAKS